MLWNLYKKKPILHVINYYPNYIWDGTPFKKKWQPPKCIPLFSALICLISLTSSVSASCSLTSITSIRKSGSTDESSSSMECPWSCSWNSRGTQGNYTTYDSSGMCHLKPICQLPEWQEEERRSSPIYTVAQRQLRSIPCNYIYGSMPHCHSAKSACQRYITLKPRVGNTSVLTWIKLHKCPCKVHHVNECYKQLYNLAQGHNTAIWISHEKSKWPTYVFNVTSNVNEADSG